MTILLLCAMQGASSEAKLSFYEKRKLTMNSTE